MYAKVFAQILDSSLAEDYQCRHVFEDLLKLADINGVVDLTHESIARRTNVPIDIVRRGIDTLEKPDNRSRSPKADGRRIVRLDEHRDWGWMIVNYQIYRDMASEDQRREKTRERVRRFRIDNDLRDCNGDVTLGNACNAMERKMEMEKEKNKEVPPVPKESSELTLNDQKKTKAKPTSESEVVDFVKSIGLPDSDGRFFWQKWNGNGFLNGNKKMNCWKSTIRSWREGGYLPSQKQQHQQLRSFSPIMQKQALEDKISKHTANKDSINFKGSRATDGEKEELKELREKLHRLNTATLASIQ